MTSGAQLPGLMMERPLLVSSIIEHAAAQFGDIEIASRETHGALFKYTYSQCAARVRQLSNALREMRLPPSSSIGSLAWNNHRHLEIYYAVSGSGLILHTCNPRLHIDQLIYIVNHADDRVIFFDSSFAALIDSIAAQCPQVVAWICISDQEHLPVAHGPVRFVCYEKLIEGRSAHFDWPEFDEHAAAALCYTSGTTGNPKGALFSHRSIVLNAMMICLPGILCLSTRETMLPVVPMFHVNGWCIPYACLIGGAKVVLPGPKLDGASLYGLIETEQVTVSAAVPTIWLQLLQFVDGAQCSFTTLQRVISGGSALPLSIVSAFVEKHGVEVRQGWGMTETVAVATLSCLEGAQSTLPPGEQQAAVTKQGKSVFGVEIKTIGEDGGTLPRDGVSQGELLTRGQWIVRGYHKTPVSPLIDGWFPTGDIATIDPHGVMQIRDRAKDLIKTGGEWISSIDLENIAMSHPAVAAAAVVGVTHPKWQERPLLFVVRKSGHTVERGEILEFVGQRVARWWVPDEVVFLDSLPVGGTGKVQKAQLREQYGDVFLAAT